MHIIDNCLCWAFRHGKFYVHKSEMNMVGTCLKYLNVYFKEYYEENAKVPKDIDDVLANTVLFCCIWSIGAALEETSRKKFHDFILALIAGSSDIPEKYDI
jgi:hypothetical protein